MPPLKDDHESKTGSLNINTMREERYGNATIVRCTAIMKRNADPSLLVASALGHTPPLIAGRRPSDVRVAMALIESGLTLAVYYERRKPR